MSTDSEMALAVMAAILATIAVPLVIVFFIVRALSSRGRLPKWAPWASIPAGLVAGLFITYFVVFNDLGKAAIDSRQAPTIEVIVPRAYRGPLYIFFDSTVGPLRSVGPKRYRIDIDMSGQVLAGWFPSARDRVPYATFVVQHPDGTTPQLTQPGMSGGSYNTVVFTKLFVGTPAEYDADQVRRQSNNTQFDEDSVLARLQRRRRL
jgi:hypothetical protein